MVYTRKELMEYLTINKYISIKQIVCQAQKHNIKVSLFSKKDHLIKFQKDDHSFFVYTTNMPFRRCYSMLSKNKVATKKILSDAGICVPRGIKASSLTETIKKIRKEKLQNPLLIKPHNASQALGVKRNLTTQDAVKKAFRQSQKESNAKMLLIEEMFIGDEYRVLVLAHTVISCVQKIPATIVGDGTSSIALLIAQYNKKRINNFHAKIDNDVMNAYEYTMEHVLNKNEIFQINTSYFMRDGARCIEKINNMPKKIITDCEKASRVLGMDYVGFDLIKNPDSDDYVILEANPCPAHIINEKPLAENTTRNISKLILQYFFPNIS